MRALMSQVGRALPPPVAAPDAGFVLLMTAMHMPMMPLHHAMPMAPHPM
jgi:hypothetical protein